MQTDSNRFDLFSDKSIQGEPKGTLTEILAYARGSLIWIEMQKKDLYLPIENTKHVNNEATRQILDSEPATWIGYFHKYFLRYNRVYKQMIYYAWRFSEIHSNKFILFFLVLLSILKVCAFNVVLIVLTTVGLTTNRLRKLINLLTTISTGIFLLASMCYQLPIAKTNDVTDNIFIANCSQVTNVESFVCLFS